jgi:CubicO group peptidase (beta-lactamase class C family)
MRPIGIKGEEWSVGYRKTYNVDGLPLVAAWGGAAFTPRAAARVARLMMRDGSWDGKQLISFDAVREVTRDSGTPGNGGIGWWTNNDGMYAKLPRDAFWGAGAGHQIVLVVRSLNMIAVRNGDTLTRNGDWDKAVEEELFNPLVDAIQKGAPKPEGQK